MAIFSCFFKKNLSKIDCATCHKNEEQKVSFIATMVHDLRNPLVAQIRILEVILNGEFGELNPNLREVMETLLNSGKYMENMLASVLEIYRYENGILSLNYKSVLLNQLAINCVEEIKYLALERQLKFKFNITCPNSTVMCDEIQIRRVVMNLLSNQIKYASKNSEVFVNIYNEADNICLSFENKSPYIIDEYMNNLFGKNITYAKSYNLSGIGLGLYASKQIIEAHNGQIFAESYKDNRNIFGFKLPLKAETSAEKFVTF